MQEDKIKEAFANARQDIDFLYYELQELKRTIQELNEIQTEILKKQTDNRHKTDTPTHNLSLEAVKSQISTISTGNEGVSTDRQTDQQTDRQPPYFHWKTEKNPQNLPLNTSELHIKLPEIQENTLKTSKNIEKPHILTQIHRASELLGSLDELKKEVRFKFKRLTSQEMQVFSTIYELEEQGFIVDYSILSEKLKLTESSIRDYVLRLIKKGIPVDKLKENNKRITLSISKDLRKIVTLETIHQLRTL
ncbi:hypothetical protein COU60_01195 [Candidatus Pacearchaeota archaeon CG10_big_fil_rev_8_21_14_0_10_34_76]|nr:MAG: hypothetical protein COU60_01195 [Candidatus Pacearchaeota archaeon CG10_big_fil_rev_8_21_14_0_10_34_76]